MTLINFWIGAFLSVCLVGSMFWTALAFELLNKTCGG
jgi:hypothetical protein